MGVRGLRGCMIRPALVLVVLLARWWEGRDVYCEESKADGPSEFGEGYWKRHGVACG
jgi:hypothetical protein